VSNAISFVVHVNSDARVHKAHSGSPSSTKTKTTTLTKNTAHQSRREGESRKGIIIKKYDSNFINIL
jgi:hypothetical protein